MAGDDLTCSHTTTTGLYLPQVDRFDRSIMELHICNSLSLLSAYTDKIWNSYFTLLAYSYYTMYPNSDS